MKEIKNISLGINRLLLQSADTWQYRLTWIIADDKKLWIKKDSFMVGRSYISRKLKNQFRRASDLWGLVITSQVTKHRKNKINTPAFLWRKPFYVGSGNRRVQVSRAGLFMKISLVPIGWFFGKFCKNEDLVTTCWLDRLELKSALFSLLLFVLLYSCSLFLSWFKLLTLSCNKATSTEDFILD